MIIDGNRLKPICSEILPRRVVQTSIATLILLTTFPFCGNAASKQVPIQASKDNIVSIEAERYTSKTQAGSFAWKPSSQAGFSGQGAMQAPNKIKRMGITKRPSLNYEIKFNKAGTYYVWLRGLAVSSSKNSVFIGLDGKLASKWISIPVTGDYAWSYGLRMKVEVKTAGVHVLNMWYREPNSVVDKLVLALDPGFVPTEKGPSDPAPAPTEPKENKPTSNKAVEPTKNSSHQPVYIQDNNIVSIEAEHYTGKSQSDGSVWTPSNQAGFSGEGAMQAPNKIKRMGITKRPSLNYEIKFNKAGTYYVWLRGLAVSGSKNSVFIGLDGKRASKWISIPVTGDYAWSYGLRMKVKVRTAGVHVLNMWYREPHSVVDKLVLALDPGYVPAGKGPLTSILPSSKSGNDSVVEKSNQDKQGESKTDTSKNSTNDEKDSPNKTNKDIIKDAKVVLEWDSNKEKVDGYVVYYGNTPKGATKELSTLRVGSKDLNSKAPSAQYWLWGDLAVASEEQICFKLKAYKAKTFSDFSEAVCTTR